MGPKKYKVPLGKGGLISDWIMIIAICTKNLGNIKLVHVLLYDMFMYYFGMISRQFGIRYCLLFLTEKKAPLIGRTQ